MDAAKEVLGQKHKFTVVVATYQMLFYVEVYAFT